MGGKEHLCQALPSLSSYQNAPIERIESAFMFAAISFLLNT